MNFKIENKILKKISRYASDNNIQAYLVGGYVRDKQLGTTTNDVDIMVIGDAIQFSNQVAELFSVPVLAVYNNFGTALINIEDLKIEFASARKESYLKDSRKPIIELSDLEDDLARRDFTINALAVPLFKPHKIIDNFNGLSDLKNGIIKTPLEPYKTFDDDPLRMLRAIRFASTLNFSIAPETFEAINSLKSRLKENKVVSQERITNEFLLIMMGDKPSIGLDLLYLSGVMDIIFPEMAKLGGVDRREDFHHKDVFYHTLNVVDNISEKTDDIWLRFAALVHDIAKPKTKKFVEGTGWTFHSHEEVGAGMLKNIFMKMKLPLNKLDYVEKLVRMHLRPIPIAKDEVTDSAVRRLAAEAGEELEDLLTLCRADITSKNPNKVKRFLTNFEIVEKKVIEVQEKDKLRNFQSPVRGEEIMQICNLKPSREVGVIKKKIEEAILDGEIPNEYEAAKEYLFLIKDEIIKNSFNKSNK